MNIDGRIDNIIDNHVNGWLFDLSRPERRVEFIVLLNDISIGTFVADVFRQDLLAGEIGDGHHSFGVPLPPILLVRGRNKVQLVSVPEKLFVFDPTYFAADLPSLCGEEQTSRVTISVAEALGAAPHLVEQAISLVHHLDQINIQPSVVNRTETSIKPATFEENTRGIRLARDLIGLARLDSKKIFDFAQGLFRQKRYEDVLLLLYEGGKPMDVSYTCLNLCGRSLLNLGDLYGAEALFSQLFQTFHSNHAAIFYYVLTLARLNSHEAALTVLADCIKTSDKDSKYRLEAGRSAVWLAFGGYGAKQHKPEMISTAIGHLEAAAAQDPGNFHPMRELSSVYIGLGQVTKGTEAALAAVDRAPRERTAWSTLSKAYLRNGDLEQALQAGRKALACDPRNDAAKFELRILERMTGFTPKAHHVAYLGDAERRFGPDGYTFTAFRMTGESLRDALASLDTDFVLFSELTQFEISDVCASLQRANFPWAGLIEVKGSHNLSFWRCGLLLALLDAFDLYKRLDIVSLIGLARQIASTAFSFDGAAAESPISSGVKAKKVLLLSQHGIRRFGGAEQFLYQMAQLYCRLGNDVLIVGTRPEYSGQSGWENNIPFTYIDEAPDSLLRLIVSENIDIVHVVSGLGFEVASALRWTNVQSVFGVHFWREIYYQPTPSPGYYPDIDRSYIPRPEFKNILQSFDVVYCNSFFTQELIERDFGVRCPILFSLPDDVLLPDGYESSRRKDLILLANARFDKGFGLFLSIAEAVPEGKFVAIASQSDKTLAQAEIDVRGLSNVELIARVDDMATLYRKAIAVLVPSFQFVETFSRVVIEAHRYGVPVLGSDRGNVPKLLVESGIFLEAKPAVWADEVRRLITDDVYWSTRSKRAFINSARYSFSMQQTRLGRLISNLSEPILIGVGSGLGNVLHTTPLIANIARRCKRRVDVVVAGDYKDLLFILSNETYVNNVFLLDEMVSNKRYDTVFITQSFGTLEPTFSANRVLRSRDWQTFRPENLLHEAEFNLAAAKSLLRIPYDASDTFRYFVGNLKYERPLETFVGLHGGSKDGAWATKRWPRFVELSIVLKQRGWKCASFGVASEYVPGTIDLCGGTIEQMALAMLQCTHFVSNDSGVMNLANAMGIPLVALFGPTNANTRGPLSPKSRCIAVERFCAPCEMRTGYRESHFLTGKCDCIQMISVGDVLSVLDRMSEGAYNGSRAGS